jgi:hypothetical protein
MDTAALSLKKSGRRVTQSTYFHPRPKSMELHLHTFSWRGIKHRENFTEVTFLSVLEITP